MKGESLMAEQTKINYPCFAVKLMTGETLLTGPMYIEAGLMHFLAPVRINFTSMVFDGKIVTQYVPQLYQPFGDNKYIPIVADHVISILKASESDARFYKNCYNALIMEETRRLLMLDTIMNGVDFADKDIMSAPTIIQ